MNKEIKKLLREKDDILKAMGLKYKEKLLLEKLLESNIKRLEVIDYTLDMYENGRD